MSSKRHHSQRIPFNAKKKKKMDHCFSQADKTQQNDPSLPQTSMNSTKCPKDGTDLQTQGPTEQPVSPTKTMNVTLKGDHRAHVVTYSEGGSLFEALTSLQVVKEKIETQKGKEVLVQGTEGNEDYINLGMPLNCFPENCHLEITFAQSGSEQEKKSQEFERCSKVSSKCIKFYIHVMGKEQRRIVISRHLHREGCKLCIYAFKEETIRQALYRDGRLLPFLESGDWKLIENGDTILENTQLVDELEGRVFEVGVQKRKLTRVDTAENSQLEKRKPTPLDEGNVEQDPCLKGESKEIKTNLKENVELSKESTLLSKSYETEFGRLTQNSTPNTQHRLIADLAKSVGRIEWNKNGRRGYATCFVFFRSSIFTCNHVIRAIVGEGVDPLKWINIISEHARVTFDYENFSRGKNRYFSIDPSFLLSNKDLDYAVLRLKEKGHVPLGLHLRSASRPVNGSIHMIGHPKGEKKRPSAGAMIPQSQRQEEYLRFLQFRKAESGQSVHMYASKSCLKIVNNADMIIYCSSVYPGSSGSPVFDCSGALVAMHLGSLCGFGESTVGYGVSLESIICDIARITTARN